jgi:hypothetical protein
MPGVGQADFKVDCVCCMKRKEVWNVPGEAEINIFIRATGGA